MPEIESLIQSTLESVSHLSIDSLNQLRASLTLLIEKKQDKIKEDALAQIKALADSAGLSLEDILNRKSDVSKKAKSSLLMPKYQNPDNLEQTWTGRGAKPAWVKAHIENGGSLGDLVIKSIG